MPPEDDERLLTTSEAASAFGISRRTLARYAAEGTLEPSVVLPSGHLRWSIGDVRRQLREMRRKRSEEPEPGPSAGAGTSCDGGTDTT